MLYRWVEYVSLFWLAPAILFVFREQLAPLILPFIVTVAVICSIILWQDDKIQKQWRRAKDLRRKHFNPLWQTFAILASLVALFTYLYTPETFLDFPLNHTMSWILILMIYPLLSVIPQEVIFRVYFFHRFKRLFTSKISRAWLSSLSFGFAHLVYGNWIAVISPPISSPTRNGKSLNLKIPTS